MYRLWVTLLETVTVANAATAMSPLASGYVLGPDRASPKGPKPVRKMWL